MLHPAGICVLCLQVCLTYVFAMSDVYGPWRFKPWFTAHQLSAASLYTYMSIVGWYNWEFPCGTSAFDRAYSTNSTGAKFADIVISTMLIWDIPSMLCIVELRNPLIFAHHGLMLLLAFLSKQPLMQTYLVFFFGWIEASSIPLQIIDLFRLSQEWKAYACLSPKWGILHEISKGMFLTLFVYTRLYQFSIVIWQGVLQDVQGIDTFSMRVVGVVSIVFAFMQWYWGALLFKKVVRHFMKPTDPKRLFPNEAECVQKKKWTEWGSNPRG